MSDAPRADTRAHARTRVNTPLLVGDARRRAHGSVRLDTRDLSPAGAFVVSPLLLEVGEELDVELPLPGLGQVHARARVTRVDLSPDRPGMALSFVDLSDRDLQAVRSFLAASR